MQAKEFREPANILDQKKDMERLLESSAWAMIVASVQEQVDVLQRDILFGTVQGVDDLFPIERKKGLLAGMLSLQNTAQTLLEELETDLRLANMKKEDEE